MMDKIVDYVLYQDMLEPSAKAQRRHFVDALHEREIIHKDGIDWRVTKIDIDAAPLGVPSIFTVLAETVDDDQRPLNPPRSRPQMRQL